MDQKLKLLRASINSGINRVTKLYVILELQRTGGCTYKDLLSDLKFSAAAFTGLVDSMIADDYVVVRRFAADRRIKGLRLTEKGKELAIKLLNEI